MKIMALDFSKKNSEKNRSFVQIKYLIILHKKNHANDHILGKEIANHFFNAIISILFCK
jgi:hypothetical protein